MKIGMNMLLWTDHVTEKHYPLIELLQKKGYHGIEIPLGAGNENLYRDLGRFLNDQELGLTAVTSLGAHENISSEDANIRDAGYERLKWAIDMAHHAQAELICGPFHSAFATFSRKPPTLEERKRSLDVLSKAGDYAQQAGIVLAPEALNRFECYLYNNVQDLRWMLEQLNHDHIGAIYDTHHAHIEEKNQKEAIREIGPYLKHVHISENDRGTPGMGQVCWTDVFSALKGIGYDNWLTIEAFSTTIPDFANAINVWRDFSPLDEVYLKGFDFIQQNWEAA